KTKFTALERLNSNDYKDNFYESNNKMFCIACKKVVNHSRKSVIDNYLNSESHKNKKHLIEASSSDKVVGANQICKHYLSQIFQSELKFLSSNLDSLDSYSESSELSLQLPPLFFFNIENMLNDSPKAVKKLVKIFSNHENIPIIELFIEFISLNTQ
ncbi:10775_t:CDS:2, partial [Scutellospora calospora]